MREPQLRANSLADTAQHVAAITCTEIRIRNALKDDENSNPIFPLNVLKPVLKLIIFLSRIKLKSCCVIHLCLFLKPQTKIRYLNASETASICLLV